MHHRDPFGPIDIPARQVCHQNRSVANGRGGYCLRRHCFLEPERTHRRPSQRREMRPASERGADVAREGPQIRPAAHRRPELEIGHGRLDDLELANLDRARGRLDGLTPSRAAVRALALDLHRRVRRRPLLVAAPKLADHRGELRRGDSRPGSRRHHRAGHIIGVGRDAEPNDSVI